ncbi:MAG: cation:proton antiporter [Chloroflexota bacterium]|nr:cation:proton antiporter [Chloroflexota bacterium]
MFLVELAVVLVAAKLAGDLATRWGQPPVLGQLVAGLALGIAVYAAGPLIDVQDAAAPMAEMANLGVVLLMFLAGLETDWSQMKQTGRAALISACLGVALPLAAGWGVALLFHRPVLESLFVGVILTATSVSITAQTLMELGSLQTLEGATVLGAAVIDDVIGLVVFSLAIAATGSVHENLAWLAAALVAFMAVCFFVGRRLLPWLIARSDALRSSEAPLAIALAAALVLAFAAEKVGIAGITGAYLAGLLINRLDAFPELTDKVKVLCYGLFVPVFLVKTGMDARLQDVGGSAGFLAVLIAVAIASKILGCGLGARAAGLNTRQSLVVGVGMVSRGEVALIVASLALTSRVIPQTVFSETILVVLATTLVTPPLLRLVLGGRPGKVEFGALVPDPV